jgi:hypothetical protein
MQSAHYPSGLALPETHKDSVCENLRYPPRKRSTRDRKRRPSKSRTATRGRAAFCKPSSQPRSRRRSIFSRIGLRLKRWRATLLRRDPGRRPDQTRHDLNGSSRLKIKVSCRQDMLNDRENILNQQGALQSQPPVIAEGGRGLSLSLSIIHADPRGFPHCCVT